MLLDRLPSKYILCSLAVHGVALGSLVYTFESSQQTVSLSDSVISADLLFESQPEKIQRELKKHLKKITKRENKISEVGDLLTKKTLQTEEKRFKQIKLEDLGSLSKLSPEMRVFLKQLREKIQDRQVYPYAAKRLRQTGQVVVQFDVLVSGDISNVRIVKKSEYKRLDDSAQRLVAGTPKLQSPPFKEDKISITLPIVYKL